MRALLDTNIVVSGLFFTGPERSLLALALKARLNLILAEDGVEEVRRVVLRKFLGDPRFPKALTLLASLVAKAEAVPRFAYAPHITEALGLIRDAKDAPILAAALAARVDVLVSGEEDFFKLKAPVPFAVLRTQSLLERLER